MLRQANDMEDRMQSIFLGVKATLVLALYASSWCLTADVNADELPITHGASAVPGLGVPLEAVQLETYRGGFDVVKNDMLLSGAVTNNSAVDVLSGSNYIANGSFANANGVPMVVQNSGSNVLIQNATIINLQIH